MWCYFIFFTFFPLFFVERKKKSEREREKCLIMLMFHSDDLYQIEHVVSVYKVNLNPCNHCIMPHSSSSMSELSDRAIGSIYTNGSSSVTKVIFERTHLHRSALRFTTSTKSPLWTNRFLVEYDFEFNYTPYIIQQSML